jgi:hypothetical protein
MLYCSSPQHILEYFTSTYLQWFTSTCLKYFTSTYLQWFTSTCLKYFTSTYLQWFTSTCLKYFTSTYLQWFTLTCLKYFTPTCTTVIHLDMYSGGVEYQLGVCYCLTRGFSELATSYQLCEYLGQRSSNVEDRSLVRHEAVKIAL